MGPQFTCKKCGQPLEEGDFMAIVGEAPATGMSAPIGRADKIIADIGKTYCKDCLVELVEEHYSQPGIRTTGGD